MSFPVVRSRHHQPSEAPLGGQRDTTVKTRQTCEGKRYEPAPLPGEEGSDGEGKPYKPAPFMGVTLFSGWRDPRLWSFDAEGSPIHSRCVLGTYYSSLDDPFREPFKHPFLAVLTVLCSEEPFKHPFGWVLTAFPGLESSFVSGARREWVGWCSAVCDAWEAGDGFGKEHRIGLLGCRRDWKSADDSLACLGGSARRNTCMVRLYDCGQFLVVCTSHVQQRVLLALFSVGLGHFARGDVESQILTFDFGESNG